MSNYPAQIDNSISLPQAVDNLTPVQGSVFNALRGAILAVEAALGVQPNGLYTNVAARLTNIEGIVANNPIIQIAEDLGGTPASPLVIGLQGRPLADTAAFPGQYIAWNGIAWVPTSLSGDLQSNPTDQTVVGIQDVPVASTAPTTGQVLLYNGTAWIPTTGSSPGGVAGGDLSGTYPNPTVATAGGHTIITNVTTAGGDLGGTYPNPTVIDITGTGTIVPVRSAILEFAATITGPVGMTQLQALSGSGQLMAIVSQSAATGSNGNGGNFLLASGYGDGTGTNGNIFLVTPDFQNGVIISGANGTVTISATNNPMLTLGASGSAGGGLGLGNNTGGSFSLSAGGTITLTPAQYKYPYIVFNGTLPNDTTVVLPANAGSQWVVDATGVTLSGHTITLQANSINWGTTIGTTNLYQVVYGGAGQLYGTALIP